MKFYKVLPDLKKERQLKLWHKALRSQWSADDLNWDRPHRITSRTFKDQLARVLTPVLIGEQSALYSVSGLIPKLGLDSEVESQFYLTTWAVDEARHTELFARFYGRLGREPLSIRRFPSGYLFQTRIVSDDAAEWLAGVLVSEVLARQLMLEFKRLDIDPVLSDISDGLLTDEARHLGFNHIYLEDRFGALERRDPAEAAAFATQLGARIEHVLEAVPPILRAIDSELSAIGIDRRRLFHDATEEARERLQKSIRAGRRAVAHGSAADRLRDAAEIGSRSLS
jgi:hypothetical protein